tara:strand:- start:604 stop:1011 length:408 start_codon:yes stop_codon:yes gene_type:complete
MEEKFNVRILDNFNPTIDPIIIMVNPNTNVLELKLKYSRHRDLKTINYSFIFEGTLLKNSDNLYKHGISKNRSTIFYVPNQERKDTSINYENKEYLNEMKGGKRKRSKKRSKKQSKKKNKKQSKTYKKQSKTYKK